MASMVALRGLILVCLLQLSVQVDVNTVALAKMIQYFDDNVPPNPGAQYTIAILLSRKQCTDEKLSMASVFSRADAQIVKETIRNTSQKCELCTNPKNVIAARPQLGEHSEYRLLYPVGKSPMDKLLKKANQNSCVVFYSYKSCVTQCINGENNIWRGLSNWKRNQKGGINAFVFRTISDTNVRNDLPKEFQKIDVIVPLYQCPRAQQMNCFKCRGQQTINYCRTVPDNRYYRYIKY